MSEQRRDAAADLAMCEAATPGKWEGKHAIQPYISVFTGVAEEVIATTYTRGNMRFIAESRTALPHWINRAVAAEAEVERYRILLHNVLERSKWGDAENALVKIVLMIENHLSEIDSE
ncbi:hypothetical protein FOI68_20495 [Brevibacillus sp. LEMMJ03]|uniref:hypothetical protein n=1 Tax=Brevibacillus sp. LEMMJ03 TaxID=2595056 RepID=UPI001180A442|nr:hypothetical protein [Brevibacillus sp. LEMMJ03]TRY23651.1 hypothetical protein FOI68_20495 [Brevibacillus sp. LEMMJ03]